MSDTAANFSATEIVLALIIGLSAQAAGLFLLRTGGGSTIRADISDERSRPISVSITPVVDDAPILRLGSKREPGKLPDRWVAPRAVERAAPTAAPPSPHASPSAQPMPSARAADAGPKPPPPDIEMVKQSDLSLAPPEAGPPSVSTVEGSPDGLREGTETDPLKGRAVDLYRAQLEAWFARRFLIKGKIPFDILKELRATAVVDIGPDRNVTGFKIVSPSGNATFDDELSSNLAAIVASGAELPAPPPLYPNILTSTQPIGFRCAQRSLCE